MWPQYIYLGVLFISTGIMLAKYPEKTCYGLGAFLVSNALTQFLLYKGGFYSGF